MDWRYDENFFSYLKNMAFEIKQFSSFYTEQNNFWDHEHCEICSFKIVDKNDQHKYINETIGVDYDVEGYNSFGGKYWLCKDCYDELKTFYNWVCC
jgi:hypothetical protein